jgi:hypothetical protein
MLRVLCKEIRSEKYRRHIATYPCCRCGSFVKDLGSAPHHEFELGVRGISEKVSDTLCVPLCKHCHDLRHGKGYGSLEIFYTENYIKPYRVMQDIIGYLSDYLAKN